MAITFVGADASSSVNVTAITGLAWPDTNNDDLAVFLGLAINSATLTVDKTNPYG